MNQFIAPTQPTTRRRFLKTSVAATAALALPRVGWSASPARALGANDTIRLAVIGLGATDAVGGVGARGRQLIGHLQRVPGIKITTLCDVDQKILEREAQPLKSKGENVVLVTDMRRVFDDKSIDAVIIALPNHWHALATIWACQAGKDVYVEKPFSHSLWEGRQMVAAAAKYGRIVQVGTQNRSSTLLRQAFDEVRGGSLGRIRLAHALVYRARVSIGKVDTPTPVPAHVDYDLWCGPAPKKPLNRKQLHYEWHWFWDTGNGEMGNNGVHMIDICRWGLGQNQPPARAMSIGGRFGFDDAAETANTQIALLDFQPAPLICEVRNLRVGSEASGIGAFRNRSRGIMIDCEGGYFAGDATGGAFYDYQNKKIKDVTNDGSSRRMEVEHLANFIAAMRSRKASELAADAVTGHHSTAGCHMANLSYRLGRQSSPEAIRERIKSHQEFGDAFERCREYLGKNGVNLGATPATMGPWVTYDAKQDRFVGEFAAEANKLSRREYRAPYVVPEIA